MLYFILFLSFMLTIILTPIVIKLAFKIGALDYPNDRKIHNKITPRLGGLSIYFSFCIGAMIMIPGAIHSSFILGSVIIVVIGILDDIYQLSAAYKFLGQLVSALLVTLMGGIQIEFINFPFGNQLEFGSFSTPLTILWIIVIINAINFIDGLDGLAAGVSSIALFSITVMSSIQGNTYVMIISLILMASTLPFLLFNFHPAKVFMGDTGSMFLGYMIAILSISGFKNITFISLIVPIIILGVPISDVFFSILRRIIKKKPITKPDKSHIHHCFLNLGFTHKQTVLVIYSISMLFGLTGLVLSVSTIWVSLLILSCMLIFIELIVERIGLIDKSYRPILRLIKLNERKE